MPAPPPQHLHTLILAAGRGTRLGGPKALLTINHQPWWRIQSHRLAATKVPVTWIVSDLVRAALAEHQDAPTHLVRADSAAPMFASILAGLRVLAESPPQGVFILPVDAPAPEPSVWHALAAAATDASPVTIPTFQSKTGHPAFLRWSWVERTLFRAVDSTAPQDLAALRLDTLIAPVAQAIPVSDPSVAVNLNTPDDLSAYLSSGT